MDLVIKFCGKTYVSTFVISVLVDRLFPPTYGLFL